MNAPKGLLEQMAEAGIVGRGGASFPTHLKWKRLKEMLAPQVYVVCNASEGEPGVLKDGYLLEHSPEMVIEGMMVALDFLGAHEAYFNINAHYHERYGRRLEELARVLGETKGYTFHMFVEHPSYIGGETGALLNAIEGGRTQPRAKKPSPSLAGIHGVPAVVDNVETFYDVARLVSGTFRPTRLVTVTGPVPHPGVYELDREVTVAEALETTGNRPEFAYFAQIGGSASGEVIASEQASTFVVNGCGSIEVYTASTTPFAVLKRWIDFYAAESCGKCGPCREGTFQLREAMSRLTASSPLPWGLIQKTAWLMKIGSFCELGRALYVPIESYMRNVLGMNLTLTVDGRPILAAHGKTVLQVMLDNDLAIPHVCYHEDFTAEANCRTCMIRVLAPGSARGVRAGDFETACSLDAADGMEIDTGSPAASSVRTDNYQALLGRQPPGGPFSNVTGGSVLRMGPSIEIDPDACVACNLCVKACAAAGVGYLTLQGKGADNRVAPTTDPTAQCVYCGQCSLQCPVGAIREQSHLQAVKSALSDPKSVVVVQMAPAVRVSLGELFGLPVGVNLEKQINAAFRRLGFDKVFDVNWGADVTTVVEAEELVERIKSGHGLPMFTSCCPAWVRYVETACPEFIPNLTTSRSPQIHAGAAYKTWWADREHVDPQRIVVVSIMPCTSKKLEAELEKLSIDGHRPVDYVLTTRELGALIQERGIDLANLPPEDGDDLADYSGAASLYGASGGVMEAALRTAAWLLEGKDLDQLEFHSVRGGSNLKKASVVVAGATLNVAVVSSLASAKTVLEEIRQNPNAYAYVEFMACPGGCLGGGGQPRPSSSRIVSQRRTGLYRIDASMPQRLAHHNASAAAFLEYCRSQGEEREHELLHTTYGVN
jgi:iron-only hydrogenase group A